jgi:hypothetical protein
MEPNPSFSNRIFHANFIHSCQSQGRVFLEVLCFRTFFVIIIIISRWDIRCTPSENRIVYAAMIVVGFIVASICNEIVLRVVFRTFGHICGKTTSDGYGP